MKNKILYISCLVAGAIAATGICLLDSVGTWYKVAWGMTLIPVAYIALFLIANKEVLP